MIIQSAQAIAAGLTLRIEAAAPCRQQRRQPAQ